MPTETAHCRIRRVRMKNGADVTVIRRDAIGDLGHTLMAHARTIATTFGETLGGFFVVAYDREGRFSAGSRVSHEGAIPLSLFPEWLAEIARRELVTTEQIHDVLQRDYVITPPRSPGA